MLGDFQFCVSAASVRSHGLQPSTVLFVAWFCAVMLICLLPGLGLHEARRRTGPPGPSQGTTTPRLGAVWARASL